MHQLARLDAHHRLLIGLTVAALTFWAAGYFMVWPSRLLLAYDGYALITNLLMGLTITYLHPREAHTGYQFQDAGRRAILLFVILAALASFFAVIFLLDTVKQLPAGHVKLYVLLSIITVLSSWTLVHLLFTLRYARLFYHARPGGGLNFPDTKQPDYTDFAYVAFGIGMTSQVADVGPTNGVFRRLVLLHSLLSFGFNTLIVALSINVVAGLI